MSTVDSNETYAVLVYEMNGLSTSNDSMQVNTSIYTHTQNWNLHNNVHILMCVCRHCMYGTPQCISIGDGIGYFTHPLDTENRTRDLHTSTNACTCGFYVYRINKVIIEPGEFM